MKKLSINLNPQLEIALKVIATILFVCSGVICFLPNWGGFYTGIRPDGYYKRVNFFDSCAWIFGVICVICSVLAISFLWTKLRKTQLFISAVQMLLIVVNCIWFSTYGSVYELGDIHLVSVAVSFGISVVLFLSNHNIKKESEQ